MSAVQAGGGKGSGQKPGSTAGGRPAAGTKPQGARGADGAGKAPGRRPGPATKPGSGSGARGAGGKGGGKASASRTSQYQPGVKPPQRFSPSTLAFAAVAVVVVIIVAFVIFKVTQKSAKPNATGGITAPVVTPASPAVLSKVTNVPASVANQVGVPSTNIVAAPTVKTGQPKLTISGKPGAVFIGGEFCPYCAAERWAIIMAFSKFGTFTGLKETTSSPWDTDPSTATFTFASAKYSSPYLTFATSETQGNDTTGLGTRTQLQPLTSVESHLWATYDNPEGFPFLDIGNKALVTSPSYVPTVLAGLDQQDIASKLTNAKDPVTQSIVGTANYLTASICSITGQAPASVCSASAVTKAAKAMGLK